MRNILILTLALGFVLLFFKACEQQKAFQNNQNFISSMLLDRTKQAIEKQRDEQGRELVTAHKRIFFASKENEELLKENKSLKNLKSKTIVETKTIYDTFTVTLNDTIIITEQNDSLKAFAFKKADEWLKIEGTVRDTIILFDTLSIKNRFVIEEGYKKKNFFSKKVPVISVRSDNPYTTTSNLENYELQQQKKWHERGWPKIVLGAAFGFFIARQ